jgi:hypothetical protein
VNVMNTVLRNLTLSLSFLSMTASLHAFEVTFNSVERWSQISDRIFVGEIRSITDANQDRQLVACASQLALKGGNEPLVVKWVEGGQTTTVQTGEVVVVFLYKPEGSKDTLALWLKTQPPTHVDARLACHLPFDNDGVLVTNAHDVVRLVRSELPEKSVPAGPRRGVIRRFRFAGHNCHNNRTAPPKNSEVLSRDNTNTSWVVRTQAIFKILSYPGTETRKLIRGCLDDPAQQIVVKYSGTGTDIVYYPVQQAAYLALRHLGVPVEEPDPYYPEVSPPGFDVFGRYPLLIPRVTGSASLEDVAAD